MEPPQLIEGQEIPESGAAPPTKEGENPGVREQEMAREPNPVKRFLKVLGPGLIVGASDDDPSGIGTYSAAGASLGYSILWTSLFTFPMMATVQYICAKVGMVTGMGLAGVLKRHYPRQILYPAVIALMIANIINIGADIGAIAAGVNLVVPLPAVALVLPITLIIMSLLVVGSYRLIANIFKWLCRGLPGQAGLGTGTPGHLRPEDQFRCQLSGAAGRHSRYHHLSLPILLAVQPGGGGEGGHRPKDVETAQGHDRRGTEVG